MCGVTDAVVLYICVELWFWWVPRVNLSVIWDAGKVRGVNPSSKERKESYEGTVSCCHDT